MCISVLSIGEPLAFELFWCYWELLLPPSYIICRSQFDISVCVYLKPLYPATNSHTHTHTPTRTHTNTPPPPPNTHSGVRGRKFRHVGTTVLVLRQRKWPCPLPHSVSLTWFHLIASKQISHFRSGSENSQSALMLMQCAWCNEGGGGGGGMKECLCVCVSMHTLAVP